MHFSFVLVVCLAAVFCLAPLGLYLLWLCALVRRDRATVLSGVWDFTALLSGLAGFFLFGGGLFLSLVESNVRYWMRGNFKALRDAWAEEQLAWTLVALLYLLIVVGGATLALLTRRRTLVVYNVEPGLFESALVEVFDHLNRPIERRGNLWVSGSPLLEVEASDTGKTVVVRWLSTDRQLFQELERRLRDAVPPLAPAVNPAGRWLMSAAIGCILLVVSCVVLLIYGLALVR